MAKTYIKIINEKDHITNEGWIQEHWKYIEIEIGNKKIEISLREGITIEGKPSGTYELMGIKF